MELHLIFWLGESVTRAWSDLLGEFSKVRGGGSQRSLLSYDSLLHWPVVSSCGAAAEVQLLWREFAHAGPNRNEAVAAEGRGSCVVSHLPRSMSDYEQATCYAHHQVWRSTREVISRPLPSNDWFNSRLHHPEHVPSAAGWAFATTMQD